ncbi:hypothetical protein GCM10010245_72880 [Streptomyces spectabilis]|nr:hypothetical protein GCM10010245_72880 [Streptomyces spectabilis]
MPRSAVVPWAAVRSTPTQPETAETVTDMDRDTSRVMVVVMRRIPGTLLGAGRRTAVKAGRCPRTGDGTALPAGRALR